MLVLFEGGGVRCWGDVIYALLHTETSLRVCGCVWVCVCVRPHLQRVRLCVYITSFFYIQFSLTLNGLSHLFPPIHFLLPFFPSFPPSISIFSPNLPFLRCSGVPLYISVSRRVTRLALNLTVSRGSIFILSLFS